MKGYTVFQDGNSNPILVGNLVNSFDLTAGQDTGVLSATEHRLILVVATLDCRIWMGSSLPGGGQVYPKRLWGSEKEFMLLPGQKLFVTEGTANVSVYM